MRVDAIGQQKAMAGATDEVAGTTLDTIGGKILPKLGLEGSLHCLPQIDPRPQPTGPDGMVDQLSIHQCALALSGGKQVVVGRFEIPFRCPQRVGAPIRTGFQDIALRGR